MRDPKEQPDAIQLLRGDSVVSSLAGAFGGQLRETRLTAMLGYLVALEPMTFCELFGFKGRPLSVSLEHRHGEKRSDILVKTTQGIGIVEAKVDSSDPSSQIEHYPAKWHVLLTQGIAAPSERQRRNVRHVRWTQVAETLQTLCKSKNGRVKFIAEDLVTYLEEHQMSKTKESVEVYARDINDDVSLRLFFDLFVYCCRHKENTRLPEAHYFAPYFGHTVAKANAGINQGVSYVSRIETVETAYTWKDFNEVVRATWGKAILTREKGLLADYRRKWRESEEKRYVVFLETPRLAFNPPVKKEFLQAGTGHLSKHFFTFDEMFRAWNGEKIYE